MKCIWRFLFPVQITFSYCQEYNAGIVCSYLSVLQLLRSEPLSSDYQLSPKQKEEMNTINGNLASLFCSDFRDILM